MKKHTAIDYSYQFSPDDSLRAEYEDSEENSLNRLLPDFVSAFFQYTVLKILQTPDLPYAAWHNTRSR